MKYLSLFLLLVIFQFPALAQFNIRTPLVNSGFYAITDTVYMSPTGNDSGNGSMSAPVLTFQKALSLLPFGTAGVNNGQAYGLIRLMPGHYMTKTGFAQNENQWKSGNTYKNVSIEGMGNVTIGGLPGDPCPQHLLILMGNHVFVKNIQLKHGLGMGLLMTGEPGRMMHDLLVDGVKTDSLGSFGILIVNNEGVEIKNCQVLRSGQLGNQGLTSPCQWPSGLKIFGCKNAQVHHCEVAFTRGEGLNFQNSLNGDAYRNKLHDNTTNFYNDNSKNLIIRQNHFYNTSEGLQGYWRGCPADTGIKEAPAGILMANEGSCTNGTVGGVVFENCRTKCLLPLDFIYNVDSIFIFNNLFQRVGEVLSIWEGSSQILGTNCISNVFFYNNTAIGTMGNPNSRQAQLYFFFPAYNPLTSTFSRIDNFQVYNNLFSIDTQSFKNFRAHNGIYHVLHPTKNAVMLAGNVWNFHDANQGKTDSISSAIPGDLSLPNESDYRLFIPCDNQSYFRKKSVAFGHTPQRDFLDSFRSGNTNVGAFEDMGNCSTISSRIPESFDVPKVYPNPARDRIYIDGAEGNIKLYDIKGSVMGEIMPSGDSSFILEEELTQGLYWVEFIYQGRRVVQRLVVMME